MPCIGHKHPKYTAKLAVPTFYQPKKATQKDSLQILYDLGLGSGFKPHPEIKAQPKDPKEADFHISSS